MVNRKIANLVINKQGDYSLLMTVLRTGRALLYAIHIFLETYRYYIHFIFPWITGSIRWQCHPEIMIRRCQMRRNICCFPYEINDIRNNQISYQQIRYRLETPGQEKLEVVPFWNTSNIILRYSQSILLHIHLESVDGYDGNQIPWFSFISLDFGTARSVWA